MSKQHDYVLIGLTGSIGSGKSTVADMFEEAGIPVLRADQIAKELMASDPEMKGAITEEFGSEAYIDGELNRPYLAASIFNDREKLERMNAIVHPRTIAEQGVRAQELVQQGARVVACEAALIFESGGEGRFDYIVVVDARPEIRMARAAGRDGASIDDIRRRDAMQIPASRKVELADFVIRNDGTPDDLRRNTQFIIMLLKSLPPRERLEVGEEEEEGDEE
jgi:dephospho-CoA kinase